MKNIGINQFNIEGNIGIFVRAQKLKHQLQNLI